MDEGYAPQMPSNPYAQEQGLLAFQVDNEEIIETIMHSIMCESPYIDETGMQKWKPMDEMKSMVNQRGMNSILTKLRSRMTKVFALSDFEEETIQKLSTAMADELIDELDTNWDLYDVRDPAAASQIVSMIAENYYAILRKAKRGLYLKFLKTSQIVQENTMLKNDQQQQQPNTFEEARSSLPLPFFFKKK